MHSSDVEINSRRQIQYGAMLSYIAIAINIIAGIIYTPWLIRSIGSGNYGLYTIATSLISMFVMDFGISTAIAKYIAQYRAEGKKEKISQLINVSLQLYLIIDAIIMVVLVITYFFIDIIYVKLTPEEIESFRVVYMIVAGSSIITFPFIPLGGILTSYEKFISLNLCDILSKILIVGLTIISIVNGYGLYALVSVSAIVNFIIIIVKLSIVRKSVSLHLNLFYKNKDMLKEILNFSVWVTVMIVTQRIIYNITPSIIGAMIGSVAAAIFGVAFTLEGYSYSLGNVLGNMFLPKISRILNGDNSSQELTELMIRVGRIQLYILGLIFIGFASVGLDFIIQWMGLDYKMAYYCALLLIAPNLFIWPLMIAANALTVVNRVKEHALTNVGMALLNTILELCLIPLMGIIGAALSIGISYMFKALMLMYLYKKYLSVDLFSFIKKTYFKIGIPLLLTLGITLLESYFIIVNSWLLVITEASVVGVSYFLIMYFMTFDKDEKLWFKKLFHARRG